MARSEINVATYDPQIVLGFELASPATVVSKDSLGPF